MGCMLFFLACLSEFSSPTANLPNSVLDPQTPHRYNKENNSKPKRRASEDWLSQYSLGKLELYLHMSCVHRKKCSCEKSLTSTKSFKYFADVILSL